MHHYRYCVSRASSAWRRTLIARGASYPVAIPKTHRQGSTAILTYLRQHDDTRMGISRIGCSASPKEFHAIPPCDKLQSWPSVVETDDFSLEVCICGGEQRKTCFMGLDKRTSRRDRANIQERQGTARLSLNFVLSATTVAHVHSSCYNISTIVYTACTQHFFVYFASTVSRWIFLCPFASVRLTRLSSQPDFTRGSLAAAELDRAVSAYHAYRTLCQFRLRTLLNRPGKRYKR